MRDLQQLDQTYHFIMKTFVETGHGPHYTEIAKEFVLIRKKAKSSCTGSWGWVWPCGYILALI